MVLRGPVLWVKPERPSKVQAVSLRVVQTTRRSSLRGPPVTKLNNLAARRTTRRRGLTQTPFLSSRTLLKTKLFNRPCPISADKGILPLIDKTPQRCRQVLLVVPVRVLSERNLLGTFWSNKVEQQPVCDRPGFKMPRNRRKHPLQISNDVSKDKPSLEPKLANKLLRIAQRRQQAESQFGAQTGQQGFEDFQRRQQGQAQFGTQTQQQAFEAARNRQLQMGQQFTGLGGAQTGQQTQFAQTQAGLGTSLGSLGQAQAQEAARLGLGIGSLGTTQANVANLGQSMLGQQAQVQSQLGALGQQTQQRQLDATYAQQLAQQAEPSQRYGQFANILKPNINSATSAQQTTVAPSQSGFSQLVGAGIGALGLNTAIGNPIGKTFGSA